MVRKEGITYVDEPYTCTSCGRQNLKIEEISYVEDKENQIILSTVTCKRCAFTSMLPTFLKIAKPGHEKDMEKLVKKMVDQFEHNFNRRMIRRAVKKTKE